MTVGSSKKKGNQTVLKFSDSVSSSCFIAMVPVTQKVLCKS